MVAGRLSGYWEHGLSAWDVAGALLVQESGGKVTDTEGKPYDLSVRHLAATNGLIHQRFLDTLKTLAKLWFAKRPGTTEKCRSLTTA